MLGITGSIPALVTPFADGRKTFTHVELPLE